MRLYLVRHAQTEWNVLERAQGHTDTPLDETGREQCGRLAQAFRGVDLGTVYSSDLQRSADCARAVADVTGARLVLDKRLRERAMGEWEGLDYREFNRQFRALAKADDPYLITCCPPGGESLETVWQRVAPIREEIEAEEMPAAIVSHGGTCSLLLAQLLKGTVHTARSFRFANAGITELSRRPDGLFSLVRYDDSSHLNGTPAMSGNLDGVSR